MARVDTLISTARESAIAIIRQEHRSIGYVVHTLQRILEHVTAHRLEADFKLIATILYYIDTFPGPHGVGREPRVRARARVSVRGRLAHNRRRFPRERRSPFRASRA